jgi:hypothetical protein
MNSQKNIFLGFALAASAAPLVCCGQSAWLPASHEFKVTPGFSYSTFDEFWVGRTRVDPLADKDESLDQYTGYVAVEYGIHDNLAVDLTLGYSASSETDTFGNDSDDGLTDTLFGLRLRLLDEKNAPCPFAPTISVRLGGIIPGTYDENQPFSVGDGAYGFESSLLLGKAFGSSGFGIYGDIGYRLRENPVPDDLFASAGAFQQLGPVTLAADYRHVQGLSGRDISDSGFAPPLGPSHGFPSLKEIVQLVEGAISYTDSGGRNYQFTVAKSIDGRNTGDKWIFGFNVTFAFGGSQ